MAVKIRLELVSELCQMQVVEEATPAADEQPSTVSENEYDANWSPSWIMWLGLPRCGQLFSCVVK